MKKIKFYIATVALLVAFTCTTKAQNVQTSDDNTVATDLSIEDTTKTIYLDKVEVVSFKINRKLAEMPASLSVVDNLSYLKHSSLSAANILGNEPGIYMGGDGVWATNINVRGLSEDRLVTLIDGARVETATDLTASLSMIDINDIDHVEVIKGAQSSLYGTGAIGGIINIITKDGWFADKNYFSGKLSSGFSSVNTYFSNNLTLNAGGKRWYVKVGGTYGNADDIMTPEGVLDNSQFTTNNISAKAGVKPFKNHLLKLQFQRNNSTDVGIPGGKAFPTTATATYSDINRTLFDASYDITDITEHFKKLSLSYFHQNINRDVIMLPNSRTETLLPNGNIQYQIPDSITPLATHTTNGIKLQGDIEFSKNNTLIVGVDLWKRNITSERTKYVTVEVQDSLGNVIKTNKIVRGETPLPTASSANAGIFLQDEARFLDNRLSLLTGLRFDYNQTENDTVFNVDYTIINGTYNANPAGKTVTFDAGSNNTMSWSANIGLLYKVKDDIHLTLNLARSFRSASLEEMYKYIDLTSVVRLGNPELKPENGYSAELGLRIWKSKFNLQASAYINNITNMIAEVHGDTLSNGAATLVNANIGKALLYGFELAAEYNVYDNIIAYLSGSYVRGLDIQDDTDLPSMPPLNGRIGIRYTYPKIGSADFVVIAAAKQDKIAAGETETEGYVRLDFTLNTRRFDFWKVCNLQVFAGIENITNKAYTNHLSTNRGSISVEPGRNFFVKAVFGF